MLNSAKKYIFIIILVLCQATVFPLSANAQDGSVAYNFLNLPSSSHIYGLGGLNISTVEDNINLTDQNPALLGPEMDLQLGLNYMRFVGETNFAGFKFAKSASDRSAFAVGFQYFGYGSMTEADNQGNIIGSFAPKDISVNVAYAHDISDRWRGGINLKYIYSAYSEFTAMALAADLGVNYFDAENDLSISLVAANLGGQVKRFNESYDNLPMDVRLGITKGLGSLPIRLSVTAWNLTKWSLPYYKPGDGTNNSEPELKDSFGSNLFRHLIFAADIVPSDRFHIGIGYNYKTRTDMSTYSRNLLSGFSLTAGINVKAFGVDVAIAQSHTGATTFMVNLTANINDFIK